MHGNIIIYYDNINHKETNDIRITYHAIKRKFCFETSIIFKNNFKIPRVQLFDISVNCFDKWELLSNGYYTHTHKKENTF